MTDRYAVIGNPIAHSKSPRIHAAFAAQTGQDLRYDALLSPLGGFVATVRQFIAVGGRGMNVTVPFKLEAHALSTRRSTRAEAAGAVNTLMFQGDEIFGDNTDGAGLVADLTRNLGVAITRRRVLLLGAGGAARGVVLPLLDHNPASLTIANRTAERAAALCKSFASYDGIRACGFGDLTHGQFDIVINATSASLGNAAPDVPAGIYAADSVAYDMMYGKGTTGFLAQAMLHGAGRAIDGLGMLVEQAAESFALWRGVRPQTAPVLAALRAELTAE